MTDQEKTNLLFKIWLDSGMTKTEFAKKCGWKSSSILCRLISGKIKTTYEHLEIACKVTNRTFNINILYLCNTTHCVLNSKQNTLMKTGGQKYNYLEEYIGNL